MEIKPAYKQTEVGVIPQDWDECAIGKLNPFITSGSRGWAEFYSNQGSPFVRITNMSRDSIYLDQSDMKLVKLPPEANEGTRTCLQDEDVLISITADIGIIGYIDSSLPKPAYINQHIALVRFLPTQTNSQFVSYFLAAENSQKLFRGTTDTGAKAGMSLGTVRKIRIAHPPLREQRAIAVALSDVDALIGALDKIITKKRDLKQSAMQQLLTGKKRLAGFHDKWSVKRFGELFTFSGGYSASRDQLSTEGHCYLHYGDIHKSTKTCIDVRAEYQDIPKLDMPLKYISSSSMLDDGDIVFVDASEDDAGTSKHVVIVNKDKKPFISGLHTIVAKSKTDELANEYRRYCFQTAAIRQQFLYYAVGTKVSGISKTNIAKLTLPVPSASGFPAVFCLCSLADPY